MRVIPVHLPAKNARGGRALAKLELLDHAAAAFSLRKARLDHFVAHPVEHRADLHRGAEVCWAPHLPQLLIQ